VQKSGAKDESSRSGTLTFNGTHASERGAAARKVEWGPALREFENFVGSRFTPACNTSSLSSPSTLLPDIFKAFVKLGQLTRGNWFIPTLALRERQKSEALA
jgi:hypothetical protein